MQQFSFIEWPCNIFNSLDFAALSVLPKKRRLDIWVADCVYDVNGIEHSLFCLFVSLVFADVCDVNGIKHGLFCLFVSLAFAETISRKRYMHWFEVFSLILY